MSTFRSGYLNLLMALLAAMSLSLPVRTEVCGELPISAPPSQQVPVLARSEKGALPVPAHTPLCHLRCRGFVASVPDVPHQPHTGAVVASRILVAYLPPAAATPLNSICSPDTSPPHSPVLRL